MLLPRSKCFQDTVLLGLQIATQVLPPGKNVRCASSVVSYLGSAITTLINASTSSDYTASSAASDLGQLYAGGAQAALNCVSAAAGNTPAGMTVSLIAFLLQNSISLANTLNDCSQIVTINNNSAKNSTVGGAIDPNDKSGPIGDGSANQYIRQQGITYNLAFENQPTATLPAAQVVVTDQLNPALVNLSTFSLGLISFGSNAISVPSGTTSFSTLYSLNSSLSVKIQASLNASTGLATWTFTSIDPSTGLPPTDPTVGFLPPDIDGIVGQGSVLFNVMPISSLTTGTQISNTASVVFDSNAAISTPTWLNTIDVDCACQLGCGSARNRSFRWQWAGNVQRELVGHRRRLWSRQLHHLCLSEWRRFHALARSDTQARLPYIPALPAALTASTPSPQMAPTILKHRRPRPKLRRR